MRSDERTVCVMRKPVGFIGLGIMGFPMCRNLLKAGYEVTAYDIRPEAVRDIVKEGAREARSPKAVAQASDVVITMLPNSPHVEQAVLGPDGVIEGARPGSIVIDTSSISPAVARRVHDALAARGVRMLDAPVSGGQPKAIDGTLAFMVGGSRADMQECLDILGAMGRSVVHVGEIGSGSIAKLCNQIVVALNIAAVSEAFVLGTKAGVDPRSLFEAIRHGLAGSSVMEAKVPLILERDFRPGFRINLHHKDLVNALLTAKEVGVPLPLTAAVMEIVEAVKVAGRGDLDHGAIVTYFEALARTEVNPESRCEAESKAGARTSEGC